MVAQKIIVIAGSTASGKSDIANQLAKKSPSVIINADSQQVYVDLPTLTARPTAEDEATNPHKLYGFLEPTARFSAGSWVQNAVAEIKNAFAADLQPIIVGGTGLYIKTLIQGIAEVPEVPAEITAELNDKNIAELQMLLRGEDSKAYEVIDINNPVRVIRFLGVKRASGRSMLEWQARGNQTFFDIEQFEVTKVIPEREALYANCDKRFDNMIASGGIDEVKALLARNIPLGSPIYRVLGAKEIAEYLAGNITLDAATSLAKQQTRNYAKRQLTWFRNDGIKSVDISYNS